MVWNRQIRAGYIFQSDLASRSSLPATLILVVLIFAIGTLLGTLAGYFGGWIDAVIMRISDMMISFPGMVLAIAVAGIMGASVKKR